jgi:hypothetical protein
MAIHFLAYQRRWRAHRQSQLLIQGEQGEAQVMPA